MSEHDEHQDIQRLLKAAGPRVNPPEEMRARVHDNVMAAWLEMPAEKATSRRQWNRGLRFVLPVAASIIVAFAAGVVIFTQQAGLPNEWAAQIGKTSGDYTVSQTQHNGLLGDNVLVSTHADGHVELKLGGGSTVQLDNHTRITVLSETSIALFEGRVYVDGGTGGTGGAGSSSNIQIVAPHALITDVGTLFEVTVDGEQWAVAMREGMVKVEVEDEEYTARVSDGMGDRLHFTDNKLVDRSVLATTAATWAWTQGLREPFKLDAGVKIYSYLEWAARDSGRTLKLSKIVEQSTQQQHFGASFGVGEVYDSSRADIERALELTSYTLVASDDHELVVDFSE